MADIDKPGSFYLGRPHDLKSGKTSAEPLLYDSKDLTTHAVCVGMTGSGKTGLCLALLEEAALDGIPAIAIDPKGDLGNLLLAFPNLAPGDFRPWIDESEAARKQMSPDEFAASQAELWSNGLAKWDEGPDRIRRFCDSVDRVIYTPGSSAGIPITVLKSFARAAEGARRRCRRVQRTSFVGDVRACSRCWASTPTRSAAASTSFCRRCSIPPGEPAKMSTCAS